MRKKTTRLERLDKRRVWHPFTQMKEWNSSAPIIIERGEGSWLIDTEGRKYLDATASMWVNVHGHGKKEIDRAIKAQLDRIAHSTLLGLANAPSIELAERLVKVAPEGLEKVFYSDNGSTAVEIALKMAFQYWEQTGKKNRSNPLRGKKKFIAFTGAYHGDTFGSMSVGEIDIFVEKYRPLLFKTLRTPYPYCYRCPLKKERANCEMECLKALEDVLKKHARETAACVIEPLIQGAAGMITAPVGFLREVRRLTRKYGVLLIADEVATGFGRTGTMFACEKEGVSPDIMCVAKGLTGGYLPLAATLTTEAVYNAFLGEYDEFKTFFHGHTYTGNPLGCAAAIANLKLLDKLFFKRLEKKINLFTRLLDGFKEMEHVGDVRQAGMMAGIELVADKKSKRPYPAKFRAGHRVCMEARKHGLIIRPLGDVVVLMPVLSIKARELREMAGITGKCIRKVTEG